MKTGTKQLWFGGHTHLTRRTPTHKLSLPKLLKSTPFHPITTCSPGDAPPALFRIPSPRYSFPSCQSHLAQLVGNKRQSCQIVPGRRGHHRTTEPFAETILILHSQALKGRQMIDDMGIGG